MAEKWFTLIFHDESIKNAGKIRNLAKNYNFSVLFTKFIGFFRIKAYFGEFALYEYLTI